ncbi:MAG: UDP-N-acetylmuramate:L-alanyl-gamma-D-glutamyl-meso-diaminopimelate ligase [Bacteroidetes bacterium ADurb.Bin416]|nr:MAG: UDP-N-acetylmuramate:L-alanyl-gamma-D-glutamyl-meso-diaminopimelate ligase [Bacteroidetes bacterium ADurb.Bin416]
MNIHFIAIGGAAMHNLALALHKKGETITGSDDEIFDPARTRLAEQGLLPDTEGWHPDRITKELDAVVLGMHAREDNPELLRAKELGVRIYSYPEFLLEQTLNKTRVVVGGSHGKTTVTSMILHVLKQLRKPFDYMVGAQIEGFDTMVGLSEEARIAVFEGDEYLTSALDPRPKFHVYRPHIAVVTGIAWDHINVFPTFENYVEQFRIFSQKIERDGKFIYFENDPNLVELAENLRSDLTPMPYGTHPYQVLEGKTWLQTKYGDVPLQIFGEHNLQNIQAAHLVCRQLGITDKDFYGAISSFKGAAKRLQMLAETDDCTIFQDFAHSPSKLKATVTAVRQQFPRRKLTACMELHTFSSLTADFLPEYKDSMKDAHQAFVYYNPKTIEHKQLAPITPDQVALAFGGRQVTVFTDSAELVKTLKTLDYHGRNLLLMSSGNFDGLNLKALALDILS